MDNVKIEKAGLNAWPAFKQTDDNGWISRFADGYTKRSNSITVLRTGLNSPESRINRYEHLYNTNGLPCIFRLLSFNNNEELEGILDSRGYKNGDHSLVLSMDIKNRELKPIEFEQIAVDEWMKYYCELSGKKIKEHSTHIRMINTIRGKYLPAVLSDNKKIVSCGLGIISDGFIGIFDIVTHTLHRNKGYAYKLISGMLTWSIQNLAYAAYVQVLAENTPAIGLYKKLGFNYAYEYNYKIQDFSLSGGDHE